MNPNTKRIIKWIFKRILILTVFLFGLFLYGGYLMDVNDRYGDLEDLYWQSKEGDIIVNKLNSEVGIVTVDWHRIYVMKNSKKIELEEFLDASNKQKYVAEVYRPKNRIENVKDINILKLKNQAKLVTQVNIKY
jgi:hypothetical protein